MTRLGVYGGTFNPVHLAHVRAAKAFAEQLQLDQVMLIPTHIPPHKQADDLADAADRLAMCRLAVRGLPLFAVSDYETGRQGKSYTFRTLEHLHRQHPAAELFLLMGADMFLTVQNWREPHALFRLATLCAAPRDEGELPLLEQHKRTLEMLGASCRLLEIAPMPLSSTQVRMAVRSGNDLQELLHPDVAGYIRRHGLYGRGGKRPQ